MTRRTVTRVLWLTSFCLAVIFRQRIIAHLSDSYRVENTVNHQQLLTDSLQVLRQPALYRRPRSINSSVALDLEKLPASIRSIRPTNVVIEGQCLVMTAIHPQVRTDISPACREVVRVVCVPIS
jgi:hypothetical protein